MSWLDDMNLSMNQIVCAATAVVLGVLAVSQLPMFKQKTWDELTPQERIAALDAVCRDGKVPSWLKANKPVPVPDADIRNGSCMLANMARSAVAKSEADEKAVKRNRENPRWQEFVANRIKAASDQARKCKLDVRNTRATSDYQFYDEMCDTAFQAEMVSVSNQYGVNTPKMPPKL